MKNLCIYICFFTSLCFSKANVFGQTEKTKTKVDTVDNLSTTKELQLILETIKKDEQGKVSSEVVLEIDGLLLDETKTKSGRDFYDLFFRDWVAPPEAKNYSIFIVERPFRQNTTFIEISINEILVYQSLLQPRSDIIEQLALESVGITQEYLIQYEQLVRELDGDERKGSGIF